MSSSTSSAAVSNNNPPSISADKSTPWFIGLIVSCICYIFLVFLYSSLSIPISLCTLIVGIQLIAWIPSSIYKTEKYYDAVGAITFFLSTITSFFQMIKERQQVLSFNSSISITNSSNFPLFYYILLHSFALLFWCVRLGIFLFYRIGNNGGIDHRFDQVRTKPFLFLIYWSIQGVWIAIMIIPVLLVQYHSTDKWMNNSNNNNNNRNDGDSINYHKLLFFTGLLIWLFGFSIEIIADDQKFVFRSNPANKNKFIQSGLWYYSRHPNYFGEIVLWCGIYLSAFPLLSSTFYRLISLISPLFITYLLLFVSGIPLLERDGKKKWGEMKEYKEYLRRTALLVPTLPVAK